MDNLTKANLRFMADQTGTGLTDRHWELLEYTYHYYQRNKVGPLYRNLAKHTGATKEELDALFPHGLNSLYTWVLIPIQSPGDSCKPLTTVDVDKYREVYMDYNGTTPVREEVARAICEFHADETSFGNPSSSTWLGRKAYEVVQRARERIANALAVDPREIFFTSCGTEANNFAFKGLVSHWTGSQSGHMIVSKVEHPAVLHTAEFLQGRGLDVTWLDVDEGGRVRVEDVVNAFRKDTFLVSVMTANNEIGTINPIEEIGWQCHERGIAFMTDAVQAFGKIPMYPKEWGANLVSISAHKIYAPKGVGALYVDRSTVQLSPLLHGGDQETGFRGGTENVAGIMAFGLAAELAMKEMEFESKRQTALRDKLLAGLLAIEPDLRINGSMDNRLCNNLNVGFPGVDGGSLLLSLNQIGVYVSSASACQAGSDHVSYVIKALGPNVRTDGIIRFSIGKMTTEDDIDYVLTYLPAILKELKR